MSKKPLIATNPYLRAPEKYREALVANVSSSTAIETGAAVATVASKLTNGNRGRRIKTRQGSAR